MLLSATQSKRFIFVNIKKFLHQNLNEKQKEHHIIHRDQINTRRRALFAEKKLTKNLESTLNKNIIV